MNYNTEDAGILSRVKFSDSHKEVFLSYLRSYYETDTFDILDIFFKQDFIKFLDTFSGHRVVIPKRKDIHKIIFYVNVYNYLKARKFSETAYDNAASIFNKQKNSLKRIVLRVERILGKQFESHEDFYVDEVKEETFDQVKDELNTKVDSEDEMTEMEFNRQLQRIQDEDESDRRGW